MRVSSTTIKLCRLSSICDCQHHCKLCRAVREYEREATVDGVPAAEVQATKQKFVAQVNSYVSRKKTADRDLKARLASATPGIDQASTSANGDPYGGAGPSLQPQKQIRGTFQVTACPKC
jgi:hypothetical protein